MAHINKEILVESDATDRRRKGRRLRREAARSNPHRVSQAAYRKSVSHEKIYRLASHHTDNYLSSNPMSVASLEPYLIWGDKGSEIRRLFSSSSYKSHLSTPTRYKDDLYEMDKKERKRVLTILAKQSFMARRFRNTSSIHPVLRDAVGSVVKLSQGQSRMFEETRQWKKSFPQFSRNMSEHLSIDGHHILGRKTKTPRHQFGRLVMNLAVTGPYLRPDGLAVMYSDEAFSDRLSLSLMDMYVSVNGTKSNWFDTFEHKPIKTDVSFNALLDAVVDRWDHNFGWMANSDAGCMDENADDCPVCMDKLGDASVRTSCGHEFCTGCYTNHILSSTLRMSVGLRCPMCRANLV